MKKSYVLILTLILICFSTVAFAERQEWIDKNYDFSKVKKILVVFNYSAPKNGVSELEASEIYAKKMTELSKKLEPGKRSLYEMKDVVEAVNRENGVNIAEMNAKDPARARSLLANYVTNNFDMIVTIDVLAYDIGTQYQEGYYVNMPNTTTSTVVVPGAGMGTVVTQGTTQQYVRGGKVPVAYGCVRFMAYSLPSNSSVWNRIDDRARANARIGDNTKPKDLYIRIINSWMDELMAKLKV